MSRMTLYSAVSMNFKIADTDGGVGWLESIKHPENCDYGYAEFYKGITTTLMGYNTYAQLKSWDLPFPYKDKTNYVITSKKEVEDDPNLSFIQSDHINRIRQIKEDNGDVWLIGGGRLNSSLMKAGLIDSVHIHIMPIILEGGIDLFEGGARLTGLKLDLHKEYSNGVVELRYLCV